MNEEIKLHRLGGEEKRKRKFNVVKVVGVIIVIGIILAAIIHKDRIMSMFGGDQMMPSYQAVFLVNGQVYFGHMADHGKLLKMTDVYYVQVAEGETQPQLIKMTSGIHGPTDEVFINRDQVLYYQNLRDDSEVIKTIEKSKAASSTVAATQ